VPRTARFEVFLQVRGSDGRIEHARLILEDGTIMLASLGRAGAFEEHFRAPGQVDGKKPGKIAHLPCAS
jgi:hypothetical protein